jgi:hypothetical protein
MMPALCTHGGIVESAPRTLVTQWRHRVRRGQSVVVDHPHTGRQRGQRCAEGAAVDEHDARVGLRENGIEFARPEAHAESGRYRARPKRCCVRDRVVDRRRKQQGHAVTGLHAGLHQHAGEAVGIAPPLSEREAPVAVEIGLAVSELLGGRVLRVGQRGEGAGQRGHQRVRSTRPLRPVLTRCLHAS